MHSFRAIACLRRLKPRSTSVGNSRSVVLRDVAFTEKCGWIRKMVPWPRPLIISDDVHAMTIVRARCAAYLTIMQSVVTSNMRAQRSIAFSTLHAIALNTHTHTMRQIHSIYYRERARIKRNCLPNWSEQWIDTNRMYSPIAYVHSHGSR